MPFEFDLEKSARNAIKHGIDFDAAQALWNDDYLLIAPARTLDEERFFAIGKIGANCWTAIYTLRKSNIRLISVRRSRKEEVGYYEGS